jgi:PAS domain S-box-containing protein
VRLAPDKALAIVRNVTGQKQMEQARRDSEAQFRLLFENMAQGAFYQQADGTHFDVNPAALEIFGLTRDEFLERTSLTPEWRVIREDGSDFLGEQHPSMMALKTGKPVRNTIVGIYNYHRGDYVWTNVNAIPQFRPGEDKPYQVIVTLHDMTLQKQAEQALRESKEKYQLLSENSTDVIAYLDHKFKLKYVSPSCLQLTGYTPEELMPVNIFDIIHPADRDNLHHRIMTDVANQVKSSTNTFRVQHKAGHTVWIEAVSTRFFDKNGILQCTIVNERDITDRKQAEEKIKTLLKEKELLLREIHHRIKNDMTAVSSILQLHAAASANPDTVQALTEARHRINILSNIYEKLYADEDFKKIPLQPFLNNLIADITRTHATDGLTVEANIEAMPVTAKQSFHLGIIINELVTNACKYAFPDNNWGKIAISVRQANEHHLEIIVSDDGVGFSFQSGKAKRKGFGCTLIQAMVSQYHGSVEIMPEDGTTVTILMKYIT